MKLLFALAAMFFVTPAKPASIRRLDGTTITTAEAESFARNSIQWLV
jgi:hypothetical protein